MDSRLLFRIVVGGLFLVSGFSKLIEPHQNFLYAVQHYQLFAFLPLNVSSALEETISRIFPWLEFLLGLFLLLGLWTKWMLKGAVSFFAFFVLVVSQALMRQLPVTACGCFGELVSLPLPVILLTDTLLFLLTWRMIWKGAEDLPWSLDRYFNQ